MTHTPARLRRASAGVATGALVATALMFAPPAQAATVDLTPVDVNTSATRAGGTNIFLEDGVRVKVGPTVQSPRTDGLTGTWANDKSAGYFDLNAALSTFTAANTALEWESLRSDVTTKPGLQLKVDFDNDGDVDGILVGEEGFAPSWWLSEGKAATKVAATGLIAAGEPEYRKYYAPLADWSTTFPNAKVIEGGWSLGSGSGEADGIIRSIELGANTFTFSKGSPTAKTLYKNDVNLLETQANGTNNFLPGGGVRVTTTVSPGNKAAGYFPVGELFSDVGEPTIKQFRNSGSTAAPSVQLRIDLNNDGNWDGTLVGERFYADGKGLYQGIATATRWWLPESNANIPLRQYAPTGPDDPSDVGGVGSNYNGTLAEWRASLPAGAKVLTAGWSLGSGQTGDSTIESITVGSTTYEFSGKNRVPVVANSSVATKVGQAVSISLPASDPDGDPLTYTTSTNGGTLSGTGAARTFTPAAGFSGTGVVSYTVTDGRGGSATGTVTISVAKLASSVDIYRVKPVSGKITTRNTVSVYASVVIDGQRAPRGTQVDVFAKGKKVGTGTVNGSGKVKATLSRKLPKGKSTLKISLPSSATVNGSSDSVAVRVIKK